MLNVVFDKITYDILNEKDADTQNNFIGDTVCLGCTLDIGPIFDESHRFERSEYFKKIYKIIDKTIPDWLNKLSRDYDTIKRALNQKEKIRVWHCNMAFSICGLALLCYIAKECKSDIFLVQCPEEVGKSNFSYKPLFHYSHWGLMTPKKCRSFLKEETLFSIQQRNHYADLWERFQNEKTNLRIEKNGDIISVQDTYYDDLILNVMNEIAIDDNERYVRALEQAGEYINQIWFFYRMSLLSNRQNGR